MLNAGYKRGPKPSGSSIPVLRSASGGQQNRQMSARSSHALARPERTITLGGNVSDELRGVEGDFFVGRLQSGTTPFREPSPPPESGGVPGDDNVETAMNRNRRWSVVRVRRVLRIQTPWALSRTVRLFASHFKAWNSE
ncbi:hypothetical protein MRX96_003707 [Rhipicephalus microplus]